MTEIEKTIGRNEPCPCGSGKKYKRCHGVAAAPKITPPASSGAGTGAAGSPQFPAGFDPSSMDPQAMMPLIQAMQRLPKGQLQRLQGIMQKAMAGKDVSREAAELERGLPLEFQELVKNFKMPGMEAMAPAAPVTTDAHPEMTPEQAREIVEKAASEGKISKDQAETLLAAQQPSPTAPASEEEKKGLGRFFKKLGGK